MSTMEEQTNENMELIKKDGLHSYNSTPNPKISSLDFERVVNQYSIAAIRDRTEKILLADSNEKAFDDFKGGGYSTFNRSSNDHDNEIPPPPSHRLEFRPKKDINIGYTGRTCTRWVLTLMTGLTVGITAIVIVKLTECIVDWRSSQLDRLWADKDVDIYMLSLFYVLLNLGLAVISAILCLRFAPNASGSGIPEVKSYLNGVRVHKFASVSLFLVKIVATVLSVSSGLVCGPEGPFIHIGAIIGTSFTKLPSLLQDVVKRFPASTLRSSLLLWINIDLAHFSNDAERRDLVGIGAACGFAAAFGAPIGGLMFLLEEASSFFSHSMFLKTLSATAVATFCLAIHHGDLSQYSVISLGTFQTSDVNIFLNRFEELPLYCLIGAGGGILGGSFVKAWTTIQLAKKSFFHGMGNASRIKLQLAEVVSLSLLTSAVTFYISTRPWACKPIALTDDIVTNTVDVWVDLEHQVLCSRGQLNEAAAIFFGSRDDPIKAILKDPSQFDSRTLLATGLSFLPLMMLTVGVAIPSGLFMPTILIGCCLGGYSGIMFQHWFSSELSPSTFALLGAAALLAGIQRSSVSLCVILVEGTGQVKVLIPVIVTVVIARYVGDRICKDGMYEAAIELNHYPYLRHEVKQRYDIFQVSNIMTASPLCLGACERAHTIAKLLEESHHNGFPVIDKSANDKFLGLVRRDQLAALLECGVFMSEEDVNHLESGSHQGEWTPPPGVVKSPLMNLAYHIKDDRYHHVDVASTEDLDDEFDQHAWLLSIHKRIQSLETKEEPSGLSDSLPPIDLGIQGVHGCRKTKYGWVGKNEKGLVAVRMNPEYSNKIVNVGAVLNRGTYTVTEICPVSKALRLFTALGLRHLIVLGGETGGSVVGIVTRANLLASHIEALYGKPASRLPGKL
jgi:H+/Cl- antiporter ClcA